MLYSKTSLDINSQSPHPDRRYRWFCNLHIKKSTILAYNFFLVASIFVLSASNKLQPFPPLVFFFFSYLHNMTLILTTVIKINLLTRYLCPNFSWILLLPLTQLPLFITAQTSLGKSHGQSFFCTWLDCLLWEERFLSYLAFLIETLTACFRDFFKLKENVLKKLIDALIWRWLWSWLWATSHGLR